MVHPTLESGILLSCSTCGRKYQHSSHLRRHERTHFSGSGRYRCAQCDNTFARRDVWRKHALKCASDGGTPKGPPIAKRGQKPRACDSCFHGRLACDTGSPCSRCTTRQRKCTYDRLSANSRGDMPDDTTEADEKSTERMAISFLLGLTDPTAESMVTFITPGRDADGQVDTEAGTTTAKDALGAPDEFPLDVEFTLDDGLFPWSLSTPWLDHELWQGTDFIAPGERGDAEEHSLATILDGLGALHSSLLECDKLYDGVFDTDLARSIFTTENRETFVGAYYRLAHPDFPITHRASFHAETAAPALLLAIFLLGSMHVPPRDGVSGTRVFFDIAEEYIFRHLDAQLGRSGKPTETMELYQSLQAALLIHCLQFSMQCERTRRRNRVLRLPILVSAIRTLGFASIRHGGEESLPEWSSFIQEETKLRIATWTALADWQQGGMFLAPSLTTIHELKGDFPCLSELWEAGTEEEFHAAIASMGGVATSCWLRRASIRQAMQALTNPGPAWSGIASFPLRNTTVHDLHLLIYALHSVVRTSALTALLPASTSALSIAISRWGEIWKTVATSLGPDRLRKSGLARHSPELCWLAKKIVEGVASGDERLLKAKYLQEVAHDSLDELHELIQLFRDI